MTFLDLVRAVGKATMYGGCEDCSEAVHRRDAAVVLGALMKNPDLIQYLRINVDRQAYNDYRQRDTTGTRG